MWNTLHCVSYDPCSTRRITEAQRLHLKHIADTKPSINNKKPWQPTHSLSKWTNKYTVQTNMKIQQENKALLNKMMYIDKTQSAFNSQKILDSHHYIKSMAGYYRMRQQKELYCQNSKIMERLQSAQKSSVYGKRMWIPEIKRNELYRSNIIKSRNKAFANDYTQLTKLKYPNESYIIRKSKIQFNKPSKELKASEMENQYGRKSNNEIEFEL